MNSRDSRVMGLDYGDKTIGVAVSDPLLWTAQPIKTISRKQPDDLKASLSELRDLIGRYAITKIVLGYPKNMNNTEGPRCAVTVAFQKKLEKEFGLPVVLTDERLSSVAAERTLLEADVSRAKRRRVIDKMAAVFILQGYLDEYNHDHNHNFNHV
jgi:putative Holliday junction resolvase